MKRAMPRQSAGMSMIESMVAMAISSVLMIGSFNMYSQSKSSYYTAESIARMQENMRFAADTVANDVRLANFWGRSTAQPNVQPGVSVTCDGNNVSAWALTPTAPVELVDDTYNLVCPGSNARANSDVLVLRHASARAQPLVANTVQVESNPLGSAIFDTGVPPNVFAPQQTYHDLNVNAYYVSDQSSFDASLPALRRRSLVGNTMQDQEVIPGVENLQVQLGVDVNADGEIDLYVDGDDPLVQPNNIHSVRLWMLVRSEVSEAGQGYLDKKTYLTPDANFGAITPGLTPGYAPEYRRVAITKTIFLRNR
jgi:type IV pilus assembly protein PilW